MVRHQPLIEQNICCPLLASKLAIDRSALLKAGGGSRMVALMLSQQAQVAQRACHTPAQAQFTAYGKRLFMVGAGKVILSLVV